MQSPAVLVILATQKPLFSILPTLFSTSTPTDYLFHSLFSLNIIFQSFFIISFTSLSLTLALAHQTQIPFPLFFFSLSENPQFKALISVAEQQW
jgi:hypothetical protein